MAEEIQRPTPEQVEQMTVPEVVNLARQLGVRPSSLLP